MNDLIDRQMVIELVKESYYDLKESMDDTWAMVEDVERLPSAQPQYTEIDRKDIEEEVWNFANDAFWSMTQEDIDECYDGWFPKTYQEAKAKYEAWKKQKDETFDTGDEVYDEEIDSKGVILRRYNSNTLDILWDDGSAGETIAIKAITKTGRHFPEVAELLEKMRGGEE